MRAVCLTHDGLSFRDDYPQPSPGPNESLIRVHSAGICSTDLELVKGYMGFHGVLGHEFVGTVVESDEQEWIDKRIVASINFAPDNTAEFARFGREHHPGRKVLGIYQHDGAMADYVVLPNANLFEVPPTVTDEEALFTEPLAAALRIAQQVRVDPNQNCCVVGPGRLGMLIGQAMALNGTEVTMVGRSEQSLDLPDRWGLQTALAEHVQSGQYSMVVDATGEASGFETALRAVQPLGTLILKSTFEGLQQIDLTKIVVDEILLQGSRCGPFKPALQLLKRKCVPVLELIDGEYPIEDAETAFQESSKRGIRKILLRLD